jgi:general secretion pathway protein M
VIRAWWQQREARERRILLIGGGVAAVLLIWSLVWHPLQRSRAELRVRVEAQRTDLEQMRSDAARVQQLRGQGARAKVERQGKSLLEGASFDAVADWLDGLARDFGVVATDFSADRAEGTGRVNARVTLEEP